MFKTACYEANLGMLSKYEQRNSEALLRLQRQGIRLEAFSNDILNAARDATKEMFAELASSDTNFRGLLDQWRQFQRAIIRWNRINELPLANFTANSEGGKP